MRLKSVTVINHIIGLSFIIN